VNTDAIAGELERALSVPGDRIAPAALAVARLEHPHLDSRPHLAQIEEFGRQAASRLEAVEGAKARVNALNRYVFGVLGFAPNREQYLDPRNNFLNVVLERRVGIPITLSIVYVEIGRRAGLPLQGVGFPGHFLVRCDADHPDGDDTLIIDPFNGGTLLSEFDCVTLLREHAGEDAEWDSALLNPVGRRPIAIRLLTNLKRAYVALRSFDHARKAADLLLALDPSAINELRDRGLLSYHLEDFSAALRDLERYLSLMPQGMVPEAEDASGRHLDEDEATAAASEESDEDAEEPQAESLAIWEHVKHLRRRVASFN
jgi:regulator of sirC expression with transglutaminase-like and TPR domain